MFLAFASDLEWYMHKIKSLKREKASYFLLEKTSDKEKKYCFLKMKKIIIKETATCTGLLLTTATKKMQ